MDLAAAFKKLSYTHLAELAISGEGSGQVVEAHQPKLIQRINESLLEMYARFPLRIRTLTLQTYALVDEYYLRPEFALFSGSTETYKYIVDTVDVPFPNDLLMIEKIIDSEEKPVVLNDADNEKSWHITGYDSFSVPVPEDDKLFKIRYRAMPDELPFGPYKDIKATPIPLPRILEAALLAFVAGKIYGNMSMEGALAKSQNFLDEYENQCKIVEERNLLNSSFVNTNLKPQLNGWPE